MFNVKNAAKHSDIYIMEDIGPGGVTAKDVGGAMEFLKSQNTVTMHINSYGGSFFEGVAIYNMLSSISNKITSRIEGIAASAASVISLAGDKTIMCDGSWFMMHEAQGMAVGNAAGFREMATQLDEYSASIAGIYSKKCGQTTAEIMAQLKKGETWLNATQAQKAGYCDIVDSKLKVAAYVDPRKFLNAPIELHAAPEQVAKMAKHRARQNANLAHLLSG
jgi:ATP-dependent protease ClpP protease subunit